MQHLGDMRRGSVVEQYLRCGKSPCCCKRPGTQAMGRTLPSPARWPERPRPRQLRAGPVLEKVRREVHAFHHFRELSERLIQINEEICEHRRVEEQVVKKNLMATFREEIEQEIEDFLARVLRDQDRMGHLDLEALELALRSSMHQIGGVLLEKLLNSDEGGYAGTRTKCGQGHLAEFVEYRRKEVLTVLSRVAVQRAYYYCSVCAGGVIPKDQELDIVGTCFSPGVRRLMGHVGGKDSFAEGRKDLEELAGIMVKTKSVERVSEALGGQIECSSQRERELALSGKLVSFQPVPLLYLALDGTGVPVVSRETEGRKVRIRLARPKPGKPSSVCLHANQGGRGGLSGPRSGVYHLCWSDRNGRGVWPTDLCRGRTPESGASGEGHRARRRSTLDLGNRGRTLSWSATDRRPVSRPGTLSQSRQNRIRSG